MSIKHVFSKMFVLYNHFVTCKLLHVPGAIIVPEIGAMIVTQSILATVPWLRATSILTWKTGIPKSIS